MALTRLVELDLRRILRSAMFISALLGSGCADDASKAFGEEDGGAGALDAAAGLMRDAAPSSNGRDGQSDIAMGDAGLRGRAEDAEEPGGMTEGDAGLEPQFSMAIYWVDVEGGAATIIEAPTGEVIVVDAGFPGEGDRDAHRIADVVMNELGSSRIDYLIITHFHRDHVGGVPALAGLLPVGQLIDHGESIELGSSEGRALFEDYLEVAEGRRMIVRPGDQLVFGDLALTVVSAHGALIDSPLDPGATDNPHCERAEVRPPDSNENPMSVGFVARFGDFAFLDLGDLTFSYEHELACPVNVLGQIDLYQTTHHGLSSSGAPQLVRAIEPVVAVMNNGARKGGHDSAFETLRDTSTLEALFQLHRAEALASSSNAPSEYIANPSGGDDDEGHFVKAVVQADGSFTVTNSRNGFSATYESRR